MRSCCLVCSFYGENATEQAGWLTFGGSTSFYKTAAAYNQHGLKGMYDVSAMNTLWRFPPERQNRPWGTWNGLAPNWITSGELDGWLDQAAPYYKSGKFVAVFLGDKLCQGGIPIENVSAVARHLKNKLGSNVSVHLNEGATPWWSKKYSGSIWPNDGSPPGSSKLPPSIDVTSIDS